MLACRFIYDLAGVPKPKEDELDDEIDRLLYIKTAEAPTYIVSPDQRDQLSNLDSEILSLWLTKKFKTALLLLLLDNNDNKYMARQELAKMDRYNTVVDKFLRAKFVDRRAAKLIRDYYFADLESPTREQAIENLKRILTFISGHLEHHSSDQATLLGTDAYTTADITMYNFMKRILVGKYRDLDKVRSHIKMCEPLIRFMRRYASKNLHVIDVTFGDPLSNQDQESSLLADIVKPATIGVGIVLFYIFFRKSR